MARFRGFDRGRDYKGTRSGTVEKWAAPSSELSWRACSYGWDNVEVAAFVRGRGKRRLTRRGSPPPPWSWLEDMPRRACIELAARRAYSDFRSKRRQGFKGPRTCYSASVTIPGYETRSVTIEFDHAHPHQPEVFADGPSGYDDSPHRYPVRGRSRLCIWHPSDTPDRRWIADDGLLALFGMAAEHLFKEAWWREHNEWLGEEHPHDPDEKTAT